MTNDLIFSLNGYYDWEPHMPSKTGVPIAVPIFSDPCEYKYDTDMLLRGPDVYKVRGPCMLEPSQYLGEIYMKSRP